MPTLFIVSGHREGTWWPIRRKSLVVGRDEGLLAQIVDDLVSRKHLQIRFDPEKEQYWAVDLKSANGVYVNGRLISQDTPLADEDLIRIGDTLRFFTFADFDDDNNALSFYKQHGERIKKTIKEQSTGPGA